MYSEISREGGSQQENWGSLSWVPMKSVLTLPPTAYLTLISWLSRVLWDLDENLKKDQCKLWLLPSFLPRQPACPLVPRSPVSSLFFMGAVTLAPLQSLFQASWLSPGLPACCSHFPRCSVLKYAPGSLPASLVSIQRGLP